MDWILFFFLLIAQGGLAFCFFGLGEKSKFSKAQTMQNFLKKLNRRYWVSGDGDITLSFEDLKGIATVKVCEYKGRTKERVYVLQPTSNERLATFDTLNGRFTIAIADNGDELFISPLGIFLYDYKVSKAKNDDADGINPSEDKYVINVSLD